MVFNCNQLVQLAIGIILGLVIGCITIPRVSSYKPQQSFADRLYGEGFKYPAYLDPTKQYNLPGPKERAIKDFGLE
jgi:hypothetical protein